MKRNPSGLSLLFSGPGPCAWLRALSGRLLGVVLLFSIFTLVASAQGGPIPFSGEFSAVSGFSGAGGQPYRVAYPRLPTSGPLIFDDMKRMEARARALLMNNLTFREAISPYQGANQFDALVRRFDEKSGFAAPDPTGQESSLGARIELAVRQLEEARDLYAYLAVFADAQRFRDDAAYASDLCAQPENPNPVTDPQTGEVGEPVIDWCDFPARLRQSVREAAYLRMIFGQQFLVDALDAVFSANLVGVSDVVKAEVGKLHAAAYQYQQAEASLMEATGRMVGNGCYVSDFFTQTEWGLIARIAEKKSLARHHIAIRLSYLDINVAEDVPRQQAKAREAYRAAAMESYLKTIGLGGRAALPPNSYCTGTPPENALVAQMAANMLETRNRAREMSEGRNLFGFDVSFTPTRPYSLDDASCVSGSQGLLQEAFCKVEQAKALQNNLITVDRNYDLNQLALIDQIGRLNTTLNADIADLSGCSHQAGDDEAFFACAAEQIERVSACNPLDVLDPDLEVGEDAFEQCIGDPAILENALKQARRDMRVAVLELQRAQELHDNILKRKAVEETRNIKVKDAILTGAKEESAFEAIIAAANCCSITVGKGMSPQYQINPGAFVEAGLRPGQILRQAAFDMDIEDANSEAVVRNLFLDLAEARYDIDMAFQQYKVAETNYNGVVWELQSKIVEARRQRAYIIASPANDPSYRMARDSLRLDLAEAIQEASRSAYLAARRAEYELAARLSANGFRMSDIYRARTPNDVETFLRDLNTVYNSLRGSNIRQDINVSNLNISVARHILGLSDAYLEGQGFIGQEAIEAERIRRFRAWAQAHLAQENGKPVLRFSFTASSASNGLLSQVIPQNYAAYWLHKMAGIGDPRPNTYGAGLNLVTEQNGLGYRSARITQKGQVALTSFAGCLFGYRLLPDAVLLGLDWPSNQPTDERTEVVNAFVNDGPDGFSTPGFLGRPVASVEWRVVIFLDSPDNILPDMDIQQLKDIELRFSTTFASRDGTQPPPMLQECIRADF